MLDRIRASIPALPPAEQRVARLLLTDARGLASRAGGVVAGRARGSTPSGVGVCGRGG